MRHRAHSTWLTDTELSRMHSNLIGDSSCAFAAGPRRANVFDVCDIYPPDFLAVLKLNLMRRHSILECSLVAVVVVVVDVDVYAYYRSICVKISLEYSLFRNSADFVYTTSTSKCGASA